MCINCLRVATNVFISEVRDHVNWVEADHIRHVFVVAQGFDGINRVIGRTQVYEDPCSRYLGDEGEQATPTRGE